MIWTKGLLIFAATFLPIVPGLLVGSSLLSLMGLIATILLWKVLNI